MADERREGDEGGNKTLLEAAYGDLSAAADGARIGENAVRAELGGCAPWFLFLENNGMHGGDVGCC